MADSVGQVAIDIVMGKQTVSSTIKGAMSDVTKTLNDSSATVTSKVGAIGSACTKVGTALMPVSVAAAGVGVAAAKSAMTFEDSMAKVGTIADKTQVPMDQLRTQILKLSDQTGISANEIADNVYNAISAGQSTGDAVNFVTNSTKLAKAGFAEAGDSLDILTTIMNAYGMKASEVTNVSDKLVTTQNLGKTTVGQLSQAMGKVIPTANAYGVNIDNVCASYVEMTKRGINTAEATTYMNSMLNELGDSGSTVGKILQESTGKSFSELMAEGKSLGDVLGILSQSVGGNKDQFNGLWGSAEAGKAALSSLGSGADGFNQTLAQLGNSAGATDKAFQEVDATTSEKFNKSLNQVKNSGIELGASLLTTLMPVITGISGAIKDVCNWFNSLDPSMKQVISTILIIVATVAPVLIIIGKIVTLISTLMPVITALGGVLAAVNLPIVAIGAAIAAVIAVGYLLITHWTEVCEFASGVWDSVCEAVSGFADTIAEFFTVTIPEKFNEFIATTGEFISGLIQFFIDLPGNIWTWLCETISKIQQWELDMYAKAIQAGKDFIDGVIKFVQELPGKMWNWLVQAVGKVGSWAGQLASKGANAAASLMSSIVDGLAGLPGKMLTIGTNVVKGLWNGISNVKKWILSKISGFVDGIVGGIKDFFGIHSPSKVMADEVGKYLPSGLAVGIDANADSAVDAMKNMNEAVLDEAAQINAPEVTSVSKPVNQIATDSALTEAINGLTKRANNTDNDMADIKDLLSKLAEMSIYLNTGELVGALSSKMDESLGAIAKRKMRGV